MTTSTSDPTGVRHERTLDDPSIPAFRTLLGPESASQFGEAVTPIRIAWRPGTSLMVTYRRTEADSAEDPDDIVVARTERVSGDATIDHWSIYEDPALPGIDVVLRSSSVGDWLDETGLPVGALHRRLIGYRAGRRAVVALERGGATVYAKIVRPRDAAGLIGRHAALGPSVPAPVVVGSNAALGIVLLQPLNGPTLFDAMRAGAPPQPAAILAVLDRIADGPALPTDVASAPSRVPEHARLLRHACPHEHDRIDRLEQALGTTRERGSIRIHGDLHPSQLIVRDGGIGGILDLDTLGMGDPGDDPANLLGHLATQALPLDPATPPQDGPALRYAQALLPQLDHRHDPADLRRRTAAVVVGLAAGLVQGLAPAWPTRVTQRLTLAEAWLTSAETAGTASRRPFVRASSSVAHEPFIAGSHRDVMATATDRRATEVMQGGSR